MNEETERIDREMARLIVIGSQVEIEKTKQQAADLERIATSHVNRIEDLRRQLADQMARAEEAEVRARKAEARVAELLNPSPKEPG